MKFRYKRMNLVLHHEQITIMQVEMNKRELTFFLTNSFNYLQTALLALYNNTKSFSSLCFKKISYKSKSELGMLRGPETPGPRRRKSNPGAKFDPGAPSPLMTFTFYNTKDANIIQNYANI